MSQVINEDEDVLFNALDNDNNEVLLSFDKERSLFLLESIADGDRDTRVAVYLNDTDMQDLTEALARAGYSPE